MARTALITMGCLPRPVLCLGVTPVKGVSEEQCTESVTMSAVVRATTSGRTVFKNRHNVGGPGLDPFH